MAGNKNSGRKSRYEEIQKGNILKIATDWLCANFANFSEDNKLKVALAIVPKSITEKHEHSGDLVIEYGYRKPALPNNAS